MVVSKIENCLERRLKNGIVRKDGKREKNAG
jgi:hypothetical protein